MRLFLTPVLFFFTLSLCAQVGISGNANFHQFRTNANTTQTQNPYEQLDNGWEIGVNYWFRLPTKRVEFMPTLYYGFAKFSLDNTRGLHEAGFQLKTNIYLFDFGGDCDCPTFGKQGPQLQKGFFLQLSPGYAFYHAEGIFGQAQNNTGFTLGAGMGLDIGLSNLLTLTPIVAVRRGFSTYSKIETSDVVGFDMGTDDTRLTTFQAGIQLSFRFDHQKY